MEKLLDFWLSQLNIDIGLTRHIEICSAMAYKVASQFCIQQALWTDSGEDENMLEGYHIEHNTYIDLTIVGLSLPS